MKSSTVLVVAGVAFLLLYHQANEQARTAAIGGTVVGAAFGLSLGSLALLLLL